MKRNQSADKETRGEIKKLLIKPFNKLSSNNRKKVLEIGAKDFSKRFASVIKQLSKT